MVNLNVLDKIYCLFFYIIDMHKRVLSLSYLNSFGWYSNLSDDGDNVDWGKNALSLRFDDYESDQEHRETGHHEDMMVTLMMISLIASRVLGNWMGGGHVLLA